ncbi:response regulator [Vibrio vulnificus]|uniref:response regulator n=1 Tax=Vibrio vulnificus TaxID=672 RepID=UPI0005F15326|nr:response regulator [Vibrio vulnificus]EGQ9991177.1 response regulator [Vibrio vulnificus]EGR0667907.1 response regulator [Vibrio vulnificus]EGR1510648.1 response regulator [Vibrio vulnificus]EGR1892862.1 response regulator [Vibrio vulnificus]EGR7975824.1 response regulator [Vibrio vulnificus]
MEKLNLICVDDQREVLNAVVQDLDGLADWLNIEECESGHEALELIDDLDADGEFIAVVISDHVMPGMTGVELLRTLHTDARFFKTRKVLLTGQATHSDTIEAINSAGIVRYFEKPWKKQELVQCIRELVTDFIFDQGLDYQIWHDELDQAGVLKHLHP